MEDKKIKLDIGAGRAKFEDYITVDNDPSVGAELCVDIENWESEFGYWGNVDEIRAHHILEHLRTKNKVKVMRLFFELLKPGGILDIAVPIAGTPQSFQDPTHISFWNENSFWYFTKGNKFHEAFKKRYSKYEVPGFEKVEDKTEGFVYQIKFKKPL